MLNEKESLAVLGRLLLSPLLLSWKELLLSEVLRDIDGVVPDDVLLELLVIVDSSSSSASDPLVIICFKENKQ